MPRTAEEIIDRVMHGEVSDPDQLLTILYSANLNLALAEEFWTVNLNYANGEGIKQKIAEGFQIFRIQTEWHPLGGHNTMIYMAKLKQN